MCEVIVCKVLYGKCKFCMVSVREAAGGGGGTRDTESKTSTPHKDVGKKHTDLDPTDLGLVFASLISVFCCKLLFYFYFSNSMLVKKYW